MRSARPRSPRSARAEGGVEIEIDGEAEGGARRRRGHPHHRRGARYRMTFLSVATTLSIRPFDGDSSTVSQLGGRITWSMTWMTPFEHPMSACVTVAVPLRRTAPPSTAIEMGAPCRLVADDIVVT